MTVCVLWSIIVPSNIIGLCQRISHPFSNFTFCIRTQFFLKLSIGMGIEEFSVFAYQCALLSGGPGCCRKIKDFYSLDTLKGEEKVLFGFSSILNL